MVMRVSAALCAGPRRTGAAMVRSMTGYGRAQQTVDGYDILFEIKSVNHRFFDFSARLPRTYGYLEDRLKKYLQGAVARGKVEVFATIDAAEEQTQARLNAPLAGSYIVALRALKEEYGLAGDVSVSDAARLPEIFSVVKPPEDEERVWVAVRAVAQEALRQFLAMREAEGRRLAEDLGARLRRISKLVGRVEERSPQTVEEYRQRLLAHMKEVLCDAGVDEARILQEAAVYADKVSVTEETVRLRSHIAQFEQMLSSEEPAGRRMDFLMQEMNREANTIGSKASDLAIAGVVVEIKSELENIREQLQNIE